MYKIGEAMLKHNINLDPEPKSTGMEEFELESLSPEKIAALETSAKSPKGCLKHIPHGERKVPTTKEQREQTRPFHNLATDNSFWKIMDELKKIQSRYVSQHEVIWTICTKVGTDNLEQLLMVLDKLP